MGRARWLSANVWRLLGYFRIETSMVTGIPHDLGNLHVSTWTFTLHQFLLHHLRFEAVAHLRVAKKHGCSRSRDGHKRIDGDSSIR